MTRPILVGDRFKVVSNELTKRYGYAVFLVASDSDSRAWPGEIGTIAKREWIAIDGSANSGLWLEFSRGRDRALDSDNVLADADYLRRVK